MSRGTVTEKLLASHLISGALEPGEELGLRIDQTLTQDATGTLVMLELEAMGLDTVRTEVSAQYVDHNVLQTDWKNPDDHLFLRSACRRFGVWFGWWVAEDVGPCAPLGDGLASEVSYAVAPRELCPPRPRSLRRQPPHRTQPRQHSSPSPTSTSSTIRRAAPAGSRSSTGRAARTNRTPMARATPMEVGPSRSRGLSVSRPPRLGTYGFNDVRSSLHDERVLLGRLDFRS